MISRDVEDERVYLRSERERANGTTATVCSSRIEAGQGGEAGLVGTRGRTYLGWKSLVESAQRSQPDLRHTCKDLHNQVFGGVKEAACSREFHAVPSVFYSDVAEGKAKS